MEETLKLGFGSDGFATIQMINGENRFRTSTINVWNKTLNKVLDDTPGSTLVLSALPDGYIGLTKRNEGVKGLLITGSGKYFSNGIDTTWLFQQHRDDFKEFMELMPTLLKRILAFPIPTVAMVNGHAFGGGAFLALACDFRLMSPTRGWLCWPEATMGLEIPAPFLEVIRAKIPPGVAQREAILFAKRLTGNVAKSLGLVDDVMEDSKMADSGKALIKSSLGPKGLGRKIFQYMKKELYSNNVDFSKL